MTSREAAAARDLLRLQRTAGNRAVARIAGRARSEDRESPQEHPRSDDADHGATPGAGTLQPELFPVAWVGPARSRAAPLRQRVNALLDRVPRAMVAFELAGHRLQMPSFRLSVLAGSSAAVAFGIIASVAAGLPVALFLAGAVLTGLLVAAVLLLLPLLSYGLHAAILTVALLFAVVMGLDLRSVLDVTAVALAVLQCAVRIGCSMAGCCHGRPSWWGWRYRAPHLHARFPTRLAGVRLVPVQLLESLGCAALAATALLLIERGAPAGSAFATFVIGYATVRFLCERLRGDGGRRWLGGLSQAQWTGVAATGVVLAMEGAGALPLVPLHVLAGAALFAAAASSATRARTRAGWQTRLSEIHVWDEVAMDLRVADTRSRIAVAPIAGSDASRSTPVAPVRAARIATTRFGLRISVARPTGAADGTAVHGLAHDPARGMFTHGLSPEPATPTVTYGLSHEPPLAWPEATRVADLVLRLRHPDRSGVLLRRANGLDVLVVNAEQPHPDGSAPIVLEEAR